MISRQSLTRLFSTLPLLLALSAPALATQPPARPAQPAKASEPLVVKVAVISYDDYSKGLLNYGPTLRDLSRKYFARTNRKVVFQLVIGSYGDVLDWYNKELVDVAFLTPQPVAELRASLRAANPTLSHAEQDAELDKLYVASHATNEGGPPAFTYRSVCMVAQGSPVTDASKLKELADQGRINFLFVDPLSISGRILPEYVLRSDELPYRINNFSLPGGEIKPENNSAVYTNSRDASIEALTEEAEIAAAFAEGGGEAGEPLGEDGRENEKFNVAFFYDDEGEVPAGLRKIDLPELESAHIPQEVVLLTRSFLPHKRTLEELFDVSNPRSFFQKNPYAGHDSWLGRFDEVSKWVKERKVTSSEPRNHMFTLERIGHILRNYEHQHGRPARLALVLSGGGAKCAYQYGAIKAIEAEVALEAQGEKERKVDIDLVVGTSGGAINALTVALGLTREELADEQSRRNDDLLRETWLGFTQKDFFSPWPTAYYTLALCSALLQVLLVIWLAIAAVYVGGRFKRDLSWLYKWLGFFVVGLGLLDALAQWLRWQPRIGESHWWQHLWLILTFDLYLSSVCLVAVGGLMVYLLFSNAEPKAALRPMHFALRNVLVAALSFMLVYSVFVGKTLSESTVIRSTLARKIARLVGPAAMTEFEQLEAAATSDADREKILKMLSEKHITPRLERDLVITGSRLEVGDPARPADDGGNLPGSLPPDIYFYHNRERCPAAAGGLSEPSEAEAAARREACDPAAPIDYQRRFRAFDKYILDVVVGSGSIYPVFPSHKLQGFENIPEVNIIDGGFAHNSPIEAAVMWKATHIILIEASPPPTFRESNLWGNALNAFNHLYTQAQLLDARARGQVEIFTLRPTPAEPAAGAPADQSDMCTFDFYGEKIGRAISSGFSDAQNSRPRFRREPGQPSFVEVDLENFEERGESRVNCQCG